MRPAATCASNFAFICASRSGWLAAKSSNSRESFFRLILVIIYLPPEAPPLALIVFVFRPQLIQLFMHPRADGFILWIVVLTLHFVRITGRDLLDVVWFESVWLCAVDNKRPSAFILSTIGNMSHILTSINSEISSRVIVPSQ